MRLAGVAVTTALLVALTGCTAEDSEPDTGSSSPPSAAVSAPADDPAAPAVELLDWTAVPGSVDTLVTRGGDWSLSIDETGTRAILDGPNRITIPAGERRRISDTLLNDSYAVVVSQDDLEERPSTATVTTLATGEQFVLDGESAEPTVNGGTWALGDDTLLHATTERSGPYCLASVDLEDQESEIAWCAPERHGFTDARVTPAAETLLTFDDGQPSCRTLVTLDDGRATPWTEAAECTGWDLARTDDGAIWSEIPKERRIEEAHFHAVHDEGSFDLGPGTSGSLTWCGDAAYFTRDPQGKGVPARLMRWDAGTLTVAYEAPRGDGFLSEPRCGGSDITVTALTQGGDEQVTAPLG